MSKTGGNGHSYLIPDVRENSFSFSPLTMMFVVDLSYIIFIKWRYVPSIACLFRFLSWRYIEPCQRLSSASIEMTIFFLIKQFLLGSEGVGGERGDGRKGRGQREGGRMTQKLYTHMNKRN
jgi:hypothetical protein